MTLNEIEINQIALIKKITASGKLLQKLYDMGFIEGNSLKLIRKSPLGDPIEVEILSYNITLRIQESKCIEVIYE
ncbi:MAG: ferrous iron transport protein A [Campylobacteraceae bacterium]|nr:ferrous iron transport protein A [Campylobacteraceae bacterium]